MINEDDIDTDPTRAAVITLPNCSFCSQEAHYDFRTTNGQWGYGCKTHWEIFRMYPSLGTGMGQELVVVTE